MAGNVLVMVNLKPRPLAGFQSNGMVVCASNEEHTVIQLLRPKGKLDERLVLEGHEQLFTEEKVAIINPKKKILERCLPLFKTDAEGYVAWNGIRVKSGGEYIKSEIVKGNVS
jgi:aminoacyl tRNA synthase complex-interacting multifunctional protein 1